VTHARSITTGSVCYDIKSNREMSFTKILYTFQSDVEGLKRQLLYEYNGSIPRTFRRRSKILAVCMENKHPHPIQVYNI
jgi:hypothetical protein